jgi:hypothetical protein
MAPGPIARPLESIIMTAITSQTFGHSPSLDLGRPLRALSELMSAGGRLLAAGLRPSGISPVIRHAREAQRVRSLAKAWEQSDPGFAADLYAAAARHEGQYD